MEHQGHKTKEPSAHALSTSLQASWKEIDTDAHKSPLNICTMTLSFSILLQPLQIMILHHIFMSYLINFADLATILKPY